MDVLGSQEEGAGGEIQLTDALARMIGQQPFHGVTFAGTRSDCGHTSGFVTATLALALARPDIAPPLRAPPAAPRFGITFPHPTPPPGPWPAARSTCRSLPPPS